MSQCTPSPYRIYLLTIWEERSRDSQTREQWRFTLTHPPTGQRQGFATLPALIAALQQITTGQDLVGKQED